MDGSIRNRRPTSWTARVLAPLLLVVAIGAVVLVVSGSLSSSGDKSDKSGGKSSTTTTADCKPSAPDAVKAGYYVVSAADTAGLTGIADQTCISVDRLIELNPNLDPQTLQVSNCVDLVTDGCRKLSG